MVARSRSVGLAVVSCLAVACAGHALAPVRPSARQLEQARPDAPVASAAPVPVEPSIDAELLELCEDLKALRATDYNPRQTLSVLVRTARSEREGRCVHAYSARFFPWLIDEWAPPRDVRELAEWWSRIGSSAIYARFDSAHHVVFPGGPRKDLAQPERADLSPILCSDADGSCGGEAQSFLAISEREMERLGELRVLEEALQEAQLKNVPLPTNEALEADCEKQARLAPEAEDRFDPWARCVEDLVPTVTRLPKARFKMPSRGTLVTVRGGFWDPCAETHAFSLETGLAVHRVRCVVGYRKATLRWEVGSVPPNAIRSAALFAVLIDRMVERPAFARSFRIPAGFVHDPHSYLPRSTGGLGVSDARELTYEIGGVLATRIYETLLIDHEVEPKKRVLLDLLESLAPATRFSCLAAKDRAGLARLLDAMDQPRSSLDEVLAEVRCSP